MLDNQIVKRIEEFVYAKPRSIQEIAKHIDKNWRTADRYVEEIIEEYGTVDKRVFREGTRGALKIIYWASVEKASNNSFQEELEQRIFDGTKSEDFSSFDIFQHISNPRKSVWIGTAEDESKAGRLSEFRDLLLSAKKQILFFSGNLTFINLDDGETNVFKVLEELVKKGISIKVICRVDIVGKDNIERLLSLNIKYGKDLVEIRHREQPLRVTVIDGKVINLKEVKSPSSQKKELNKKTFIFYTIKDADWAEWLSKIFWNMFSKSIGSQKRLEEIAKLKR